MSETLLALYHDLREENPIEALIDAVRKVVPHVWTSVDEVRSDGTMVRHGGRNREIWPRDMGEALNRIGNTNPVIAAGFVPTVKLSDFCSMRQFRDTAYFGEFFETTSSFRDQAALVVRTLGGRMGFCINHEQLFTAEDLFLLELLQPHLERILDRASTYFKVPANPPLTPREREVLHWLAEGKRDGEIAVILGASERTIKHHVSAILRKLNVETRTAAAAAAWRARSTCPNGQTPPAA